MRIVEMTDDIYESAISLDSSIMTDPKLGMRDNPPEGTVEMVDVS